MHSIIAVFYINIKKKARAEARALILLIQNAFRSLFL